MTPSAPRALPTAPSSDRRRPLARAARLLPLLALLASCATPPAAPPPDAGGAPAGTAAAAAPAVADLAARYATLARSGGHLYTLDPAASVVRIYVFRDGRAARLGHNHVLAAPRFDGWAWLPEGEPGGARFDLVFRLDALTVDDPALRAQLGPAYASHLTQAMIDGTRDHMLGESNMQADRWPEVRIHALEVAGALPHLAARVAITMHGRTREQWVPLHVEVRDGALHVDGGLVLKQTDYGITPYSVAGGLLSVKDEVVVDFALAGR